MELSRHWMDTTTRNSSKSFSILWHNCKHLITRCPIYRVLNGNWSTRKTLRCTVSPANGRNIWSDISMQWSSRSRENRNLLLLLCWRRKHFGKRKWWQWQEKVQKPWKRNQRTRKLKRLRPLLILSALYKIYSGIWTYRCTVWTSPTSPPAKRSKAGRTS